MRGKTTRLTATCNQMNTLCKKLASKKGPQCACSVLQDVCLRLLMHETFPGSFYNALLFRGQFLQPTGSCLFMFFTKLWHVESSLEISAKTFLIGLQNRAKHFTFVKLLCLWCWLSLSGHVISGHLFVGLVQFINFPLSHNHI